MLAHNSVGYLCISLGAMCLWAVSSTELAATDGDYAEAANGPFEFYIDPSPCCIEAVQGDN